MHASRSRVASRVAVQNVFVFSRDAVGAGARFRSRETYRTKKRQTRGWIIPSSFQRPSMRSIRAVSRYSRLVGVLSVVAGGSRTSRRATAPIGKKLDRQNSRQKRSPTTPPVAARLASFLSSSSPSGILWWSPSSFVVLARRRRANVPRISRVRPPRGASARERRNGSVARRRLSSHPCSSPDE